MSQKRYAQSLGIRLRKTRTEAKLTLLKVGEACGVTASRVSQWEAGNGVPNAKHLFAFADLAGCDMNYLICGSQKITMDLTDMWPGNRKLIMFAVAILHSNEQARDKHWERWWQANRSWEGAGSPQPPWYTDIDVPIKLE